MMIVLLREAERGVYFEELFFVLFMVSCPFFGTRVERWESVRAHVIGRSSVIETHFGERYNS